MAAKQSFEEKLQACINTMLRTEYPFTHTSDIVEIAGTGAKVVADGIIAKKRNRKEGVRPLQLMDLPPEIRNRIFEYAVGCFARDKGRATINLQGIYSGGSYYKWAAAQPAVTRVSRQLRKETLEMFYEFNRFVIELTHVETCLLTKVREHRAGQWLETIRPQHATAIKAITIRHSPGALQKLRTTISHVMAEPPFSLVAAVAKLGVL
ncbi:hypothetical protein LTR56_019604 [Elasticomyces elasticus]|nr:hypothetical protein LTR56_019604 [Elasticomyces elasticus]KAK3634462.1 hypothetical protein LTR22_019621 [Elasticomyces elasticus]KAK4917068.1 hypothetical protein LTR49_014971 [Elasticomyces elasticus]KAK5750738.1 hypothetical protein LTS12_019183 [Elasticomyces elasticus]